MPKVWRRVWGTHMANIVFDEGDREYARNIIKEFLETFELASFKNKCADHGVKILYRNAVELGCLTGLIVERIYSRTPFSMLRAGDGEGNVLSLALPGSRPERDMKWLNSVFQMMDGQTISTADGKRIASSMANAFDNADVIGTRLFRHGDENGVYDETKWFLDVLSKGETRGPVGALKAIQFVESLIDDNNNNKDESRILTSAWVHLYFIEQLDTFIKYAEKVIVISGRTELADKFATRYVAKNIEFVGIPLQASDFNTGGRIPHYPRRYNETISKIQENARGALVLVGAGIFGKMYCDIAKRSGGIALDMGSAFDLLAGAATRPIHERIDIKNIKWI